MTRQQWDVLTALIEEWWPSSSMTPARQAAWFIELEAHDATAVERALRDLLREGKAFAPSLSEIVHRLEQTTDAPSWTTALALIRRALEHGFAQAPHDPVAALTAGQGWLEERDVVVGAFARDYGLRQLWEEPTAGPADDDGPDQSGMVRSKLEKAYARFCEQFARDERRAGLDVAMQRRSLTSGPRRLDDPLAAAGLAGRPELPEGQP